MAELGPWATGNGWYPAKPSGHSLENLRKSPVFARFSSSGINKPLKFRNLQHLQACTRKITTQMKK